MRIQPDRYTVIPRTLSFLFHEDKVLLLQLAQDRGAWQGLFNGIGGHIDQGEDPASAARREIAEETGLTQIELALLGVIAVDTGSRPGIALYVFAGELEQQEAVSSSHEGVAQWIPIDDLEEYPQLEDLPFLITHIRASQESGKPFSVLYSYDPEGSLIIESDP